MSLPSEAAVRPLPRELETPPVTKRYLVGEELAEKLVEGVETTCWLSPFIPASVFTGFNLTVIVGEIGNLL